MVLVFVPLPCFSKERKKYNELLKLLRKHGCYEVRADGKHPIWYSPITGKTFMTSHHGSEEVKNGTCDSILKAAGIKK